MQVIVGYLVVFVGGGLGATLRHGVNRAVPLLIPANFPVATMLINVTGSLLMGIMAGWFTLRGQDSGQPLRLFLTTGILGGYTTFSTFSLEAALLWSSGNNLSASAYVLGSVALSIIAVFAGLALMRTLLP